MPRQPSAPKKMATATAATEDATAPPVGFTPERFEQELKDLAHKARSDTWSSRAIAQVSIYARTAVLLSLLGIYSNVSQLALSPVYGSIPAATWHSKLIMVGTFIGWAGNLALRQFLPVKTAQLLPLVAIYIPTVQFFLYSFSDVLGAQWGPRATEALTLVPLALFSAACVADHLEGADLSMFPKFIAEAGPGLGSWGFFKFMEHMSATHLQVFVGKGFFYTRLGMEMLLAASYTVFAPSKLLALTLPALLHTALFNTHVLTPSATVALNNTMIAQGWTLLERRESVTGYISVLQNLKDKFRVLRCDHSILGGDWVDYRGEVVTEPVYGIFVMLEAVRLVERVVPVADSDARALVVGLGIGTMPSAMVAHGIDTTVVEIDPVVHEFAAKYFQLRENNPPVLEDAIGYTARLVNESKKTFDYIVHDVFTGGAEPVELFTIEFLQNLRSLLKPDGVIAINYAGDFTLPAPRTIVRTIQEVFPMCRMFRESPADPVAIKEKKTDFTNMVIFCKKTVSPPLTFRRAVEEDYLMSHARQSYLEPQNEVDQADFFASPDGKELGLLRRNETGRVTEWHKTSAAGHWAIMRTVIPPQVWESW